MESREDCLREASECDRLAQLKRAKECERLAGACLAEANREILLYPVARWRWLAEDEDEVASTVQRAGAFTAAPLRGLR